GESAGFWLGPSVLDHVAPGMGAYDDEIFGPVLNVARADSYEDAVDLVNSSPYGNGTAVFTNDGGAARRFVSEIQVGMVGVNVPIPVPMAFYSFGGWKNSLFGDTHVHGTEGVHFYTRGKVVTSRWLDPSHGGVSLGFPVNSQPYHYYLAEPETDFAAVWPGRLICCVREAVAPGPAPRDWPSGSGSGSEDGNAPASASALPESRHSAR